MQPPINLNTSSYVQLSFRSTTHPHHREPEEIAALRDRSLDPADAELLAERFKLLADPGRVRMVSALIEAGELCVCDLAEVVGSSESATSHQLRQMRLAGLVRARKQGRSVYYRVADSHIRLLLDVAVEHYLHGDPR